MYIVCGEGLVRCLAGANARRDHGTLTVLTLWLVRDNLLQHCYDFQNVGRYGRKSLT